MKLSSICAAALAALILTVSAAGGQRSAPASRAAASAADSAGAHAAAVGFLAAFDSLQWEPFRAYFADDVTMFFPFPDTPRRADGRDSVEARFRRFFDAGLAAWTRSGRTGPPRMGINPRDLRVQVVGDVAIVSFHLGTTTPSRRSVVFARRAPGEWKVVHWHASPPPAAPPAAAPPPSAPAAAPAPPPGP
jgi:ketosteroid isomerase-like protein